MINSGAADTDDKFDLERFVIAQRDTFDHALEELKQGRKKTHWMWFIFPQIEGLGGSPMTRKYSIKSLAEARAYLAHPVLGQRLAQCADAVFNVKDRTALEIMGHPDYLKLKSSMTLFDAADEAKTILGQVLDKYYSRHRDDMTLAILTRM